MDLAHHLFTLTFDGQLYIAPIPSNLSNVLDLGTGTGIWAIDFADEHPNTAVIGTDISSIQPTWVPPNLKFEIDDCEAEWTYADRCLKPGGYVEHTEYAPVTEEQGDSPEERYIFGKSCIEAGKRMGRTQEVIYNMYNWMHDAGFQDIVEKRYKWPLGPWAKDPKLKELGVWARAHADAGLEDWCLAPLTGVLGWSYEEVQVRIAKARQTLWDRTRHLLHEMKVVYGGKPSEPEEQGSGAFV